MVKRYINAITSPDAVGGYSQAVESTNTSRRLYISGQIPLTRDGTLPATFREQAILVWGNIEAQINAAAMTLDDIVKVTIFLSDRKYAAENREVRQAVLGHRAPALTVMITGIFDEKWLLEIEAIAET
jgi:2-iminobutanoate/2-iminopropanoate deaminase